MYFLFIGMFAVYLFVGNQTSIDLVSLLQDALVSQH